MEETEEKLSGLEFKTRLEKPENIIKDLRAFVAAAEAFNGNLQSEDIVSEYLHCSGGCSELFQFLEGNQKKDDTLVTNVFSVLKEILLRIAGDLNDYTNAGLSIVNNLLQNHLGLFYSLVNPDLKAKFIKPTLQLLTCIVALGNVSAKKVLKHFNFNSIESWRLLNIIDVKDPLDVRTSLIHFILSFLIVDDNDIIRQIIAKKGLMSNVFLNLKFDRVETIQLFLSTLLNKVVKNLSLSKTLKMKLFTENALKGIIELYDWQGPTSWKQRRKQDSKSKVVYESEVSEELMEIRDLCCQFLKDICCSIKHGIAFLDSQFGFSGKNNNFLITKVLKSIEKPYLSNQLQELVVNILVSCPDQIKFYLPSLSGLISPRQSSLWSQVLNFVQQIFERLNVSRIIYQMDSNLTMQNKIAILSSVCIPNILQPSFFSDALQNDNLVVRDTSLKFLQNICKCVKRVIDAFHLQSNLSKAENQRVVQSIWNCLIKILPRPNVIFYCWQRGLNLELVNSIHSQDFIDVRNHLSTILGIYEFFHDNIPSSTFADVRLDYFKLLSGLKQCKMELQSDAIAELQLKVLLLMSRTETTKMIVLLKIDNVTVLDLLIDIAFSSDNIAVKNSAKQVLIKILLQTGLFPEDDEVLLWVNLVLNSLPKHKEQCIQFFGQIIENVYTDQQLHFDTVIECVLQSLEDSPQTNSDSARSVEGIFKEVAPDGNSFSRSKFNLFTNSCPFSPLVNAAFEIIQKETNVKVATVMKKLLEQVIMGICHLQKNPKPFLCFLKKNKPLLSASLLPYLKSINSELFPDEGFGPMKKLNALNCGLNLFLQKLFMNLKDLNSDNFEADLSEYLSVSESSEMKQNTSQLLFYISILLERKDSEKPIECFLRILKFLTKYQLDKKQLGDPANTNTDFIESDCELGIQILKHPVMIEWFLKDESSNSYTITDFIIQIMELFNSSKELTIYKRLYCSKMVSVISKKLSSHQNQSSCFENVIKQQWMEPFFSVFSASDCVYLCTSLTSIPLNLFLKSGSSSVQWLFVATAKILAEFIEEKSQPLLPVECLQLMIKLWMKICRKLPQGNTFSTDLEVIISKLLVIYPMYSSVFSSEFLLACVNNLSEERSKIVSVLLTHNIFLRNCFEEFCLREFHPEKNVLPYLPIFKDYMMSVTMNNPEKEINDNMYNIEVINLFYQCFWNYFIEELIGKHDIHCCKSYFSDYCNIIQIFISLKIPGRKDLKKLFKCIFNGDSFKLLLHKEGLNLTRSLYCYLKNVLECSKKLQKTTTQILEACLQLIVLTSSKSYCWLCPRTGTSDIIHYCNTLIQKDCSNDDFHTVINEEIKLNFVKSALKNGLRNNNQLSLLDVVNGLCRYQPSATSEQILQMIISHSSFVPIMLGTDVDFTLRKDKILDILITLCEQMPSLCCSSHIPLLLGAYGATLKKTDRKLYLLIVIYEKNGIDMQQFRPYFWGPSAVSYYTDKQNLGLSYLNQPKMTEVLTLLDRDILQKSIHGLPLNLSAKVDLESLELLTLPNENIYDPRFLLPVYSQLLKPEAIVHCFQFIESGSLGFLFALLSSSDDSLRAAAYHNLAQFYHHLQGSSFSQRQIWIHILDSLRNGLKNPNTQLPNLISQFLARASYILLTPDHTLYKFVSSFLLLKPTLDIWNVPEFFRLFNSTDIQHHKYRAWFLSFLQESLRLPLDYFICEKRHVFKLLLSFCDSSLCDYLSKIKILDVLHSAVKMKQVAWQLVKHHNLMSYLHGLIIKSSNDDPIIAKIISILDEIWFGFLNGNDDVNKASLTVLSLIDQENAAFGISELEGTDDENGIMSKTPLLPIIFTCDCFLTVKAVLSCLKARLSIGIQYWKMTVSLLSSILEQFNHTSIHLANHSLPEALPQLSPSRLLDIIQLDKTFLEQKVEKYEEAITVDKSQAEESESLERSCKSDPVKPQGSKEMDCSSLIKLLVQWLLIKFELKMGISSTVEEYLPCDTPTRNETETQLWKNSDETFCVVLSSLEYICRNVQLRTDSVHLGKQILILLSTFINTFGEKLFTKYQLDSSEIETLVKFIIEGYNVSFPVQSHTFRTVPENISSDISTNFLIQLNEVFILLIQHFRKDSVSVLDKDDHFSIAVQIQKTLHKPSYCSAFDDVIAFHSKSKTNDINISKKRTSAIAVSSFLKDIIISSPSPETYNLFCQNLKSVRINKRKNNEDVTVKRFKM